MARKLSPPAPSAPNAANKDSSRAAKAAKPNKPASRRTRDEEIVFNFFLGVALFAISMLAFWQAYHAGFIWDDDQLLTASPQVHDPHGWWALWLKPTTADYFPLTLVTLWFQWQFSHLDSGAYHFANILFHAITVVLTWQTLKRLNIRGAWVAAAIFAIHPICVESVAWISERKNTVSQIFFLLSIINYVRYQERGPLWRYIVAVACFTLSLLAKTAVVMLPFILMILTWWRYRDLEPMRESYELEDNPWETGILVWSCAAAGEAICCAAMIFLPGLSAICGKVIGAFGQDPAGISLGLALVPFVVYPIAGLPGAAVGYVAGLQVKKLKIWNRFAAFELIRMVPFFLAAVVLGAITVYFQYGRAIGDEVIPIGNLWQRACSASFAAGFYLYSALWPFNIIEIYPEWHRHFATPERFPIPHLSPPAKESIPYYYQVIPGLLIAGLLFYCWRRRAEPWGRAMLTGLGCYFAAMLPALGFLTMSYMRLTLVADHFQYISIVAVIALVVSAAFTRSFNPIYLFLAAAVLSLITYLNWGMTQENHTYEILWIVGLIALGLVPKGDDSTWKIVSYGYLSLVFLCFSIVTFNLAAIYQSEQSLWSATLAKNPNSWQAHNHLGASLYMQGDIKSAFPHFLAATQLKPENPESHNNLGLAESYFGMKEAAIEQFKLAVRIKDDSAMDTNLANAYEEQGQYDIAIDTYKHALKLQPTNASAWCNMGYALMRLGVGPPTRIDLLYQAIQAFMNCIELDPNMPQGRQNLNQSLRTIGIDPDAPVITGTYPFDVKKAIELLKSGLQPPQR